MSCTKSDPPVAVNSGDTFPLGTTTVNCTATDKAGNVATGSFKVTIAYDFGGDGTTGAGGGFLAPVDDFPTFNEVKAGAMVPVKFSLGGNYGEEILYVTQQSDPEYPAVYPISREIAFETGTLIDPLEAVTTETNAAGLRYDETTGQYVYNWKTKSDWSRIYRRLVFKFKDGSEHLVNFKFK